MHSTRRLHIVVLLILALLGAGAIYIVLRPEPPAPIVGAVRTTEVVIAPDIGGQLGAIKVRKGDHVHAGDVLAELAAPKLSAAVAQAKAARAVAIASRDNVYSGVRDEQRAVLAAEIRKANSRLTYAQAQHDRVAQLAREQFAALQTLDQADADIATGHADVAEAQANYDAAQNGPTKEELGIADAQVLAATAAVDVLERQFGQDDPEGADRWRSAGDRSRGWGSNTRWRAGARARGRRQAMAVIQYPRGSAPRHHGRRSRGR